MSPITRRALLHSRRALLHSTALFPVAFAIASCAGTTPAGTPGIPVNVTVAVPAWTNAIQAIGQFLSQQFLPALTGAGVSIPSSAMNTIDQIIAGISGAASSVNTATTQSQGASVLTTIENFVNQLAPVAAPLLALIPGVGPILSIAFAALPAIEGLVNMGSTLLTPLVAQIAAAPVPIMPTAAARPLTAQEALQLMLQRAAVADPNIAAAIADLNIIRSDITNGVAEINKLVAPWTAWIPAEDAVGLADVLARFLDATARLQALAAQLEAIPRQA